MITVAINPKLKTITDFGESFYNPLCPSKKEPPLELCVFPFLIVL